MSQTPAKNKTGLFLLLATVLVCVLAVAVVGWKRGWIGLGGNTEQTYETPALSADYLPSDASAVLYVNMRETQDSKYVKKEFGPLLRQLRELFASDDMQQSLGIDVTRDLDWMKVTVTSGDVAYLVMMSGHFDPKKFKPSEKGLRQVKEPPGDRYRLYALPYPQVNGTLTLTVGDNLLLMSDKASRVNGALEDAVNHRQPSLDDPTLRQVLKIVDTEQTIWGAASLQKPKPTVKSINLLIDPFIRQIIQDTDALYGGLKCKDDVQGKFHLLTGDETKGANVENSLKEVCNLARFGIRFGSISADNLPLAKLLASGKVTRDGTTVTLSCGLP